MGKLSSFLDDLGSSYLESEMGLDKENSNNIEEKGNVKSMEEEYYTTNNVASFIKGLAIFIAFLGAGGSIIACLSSGNMIISVVGFVSSLLIGLFLYAFGEVIEILHDTRTNSEHIRDYLESRDKNNGKEN